MSKTKDDAKERMADVRKPKKGDQILVTRHGQDVFGETEWPAIVTKVLDENRGFNVVATAFPPNGVTHFIDAAIHVDSGASGNCTWRWAPEDE